MQALTMTKANILDIFCLLRGFSSDLLFLLYLNVLLVLFSHSLLKVKWER